MIFCANTPRRRLLVAPFKFILKPCEHHERDALLLNFTSFFSRKKNTPPTCGNTKKLMEATKRVNFVIYFVFTRFFTFFSPSSLLSAGENGFAGSANERRAQRCQQRSRRSQADEKPFRSGGPVAGERNRWHAPRRGGGAEDVSCIDYFSLTFFVFFLKLFFISKSQQF